MKLEDWTITRKNMEGKSGPFLVHHCDNLKRREDPSRGLCTNDNDECLWGCLHCGDLAPTEIQNAALLCKCSPEYWI